MATAEMIPPPPAGFELDTQAVPPPPEGFLVDGAPPDLSKVKLDPYQRAQLENPSATRNIMQGTPEDAANVFRAVGALPAVAAQGLETAGAAGLNYLADLWRADTASHPTHTVTTPDEQGRPQMREEPAPLPFEPGKPVMQLHRSTVMQPEGNDFSKLVEGFLTPGNLAAFPFGAAKPVQAYFLAQTAPATIHAATQLLDPSVPLPERQAAATEALLSGIMSHGIAKHLLQTKAGALAEALDQAEPTVPARDAAPVVQTTGPLPEPPAGFVRDAATQSVVKENRTTDTAPELSPSPEEIPTVPVPTSPQAESATAPASDLSPATDLVPAQPDAKDIAAMKSAVTTERAPDVLDDIENVTSGPVKFDALDHGQAIQDARAATFTEAGKPSAVTKRLNARVSTTSGLPADKVLKALVDENPKYADWTADDLREAIVQAHTQREAGPDVTAEARQLAETKTRDEEFGNIAFRARRQAPAAKQFDVNYVTTDGRKGIYLSGADTAESARAEAAADLTNGEKITSVQQTKLNKERFQKASQFPSEQMLPEHLFAGDEVKFNGRPMRVTGFAMDAETGKPFAVELEGAYGKQSIPVGTPLHIDAGSLKELATGQGGSALAASRARGVRQFPKMEGSLPDESKAGSVPAFPKLEGTMPQTVVQSHAPIIRPLQTPELLRLAREFAGSEVAVGKLRAFVRGYAKGKDIALSRDLFADPDQVAQTLAHEIGHVNDFMPEGTLKRGNLLGRLIGSTRKFLEGTFGGYLKNDTLRTELKELSAYWRPWDEAKAGANEKKYRNSAKELYADALSVLLNSPGLLQQKAPTFYREFFKHLDAKPRFKEEFFALQDLLNRGPEAVLAERSGQSREAFEKGEQILHEKILERQSERNSFKDFLTKIRMQSLDAADYVRRKLKSGDPRNPSAFDQVYESWKLEDNRNTADLQRIYHTMVQPLTQAGLDVHAFGQVLELQRIAGGIPAYKDMQALRKQFGPERMAILKAASEKLLELERKGLADAEAEAKVVLPLEAAGIPVDILDTYRQLATAQGTRAEIANPQGRSPVMAEAELNHLLDGLTPEQRQTMLVSAAKFRELVFERATEARDVGIINATTYEHTIVPNRDNYAAFRPLDKIETFVSPVVRKAHGTLADIENPFITTLLKLQSLNNLIELQKVKNLVRDQFTQMFPTEFTKAPVRWNGRGMSAVPAKPGTGRVKILENGKLVEYDADPYVAAMFEKSNPQENFWLNKILEVPFRTGIYPLIIKYNPGFLFAFNPRRDMARTIRNLYAVEGVPRRELLPNYASPEVWTAVNDYLQGRPNPLAEAMIKNKAITTSWQGFSRIDQADVMTDLLRRYKLAAEPERNAAKRALMWLPNKINEGGAFLEALPKFASYKTLIERGVGPDRAAYLVRNYAGTPNFTVKGSKASAQNSYLPFLNIFLQGWRADLRLAMNPKTASGWWMQWMLQHGWQAMFVGLASAGVFGPDIKRRYDGVSEFDKTNYGVLPVGEMPGGEFGSKTVYVRFPRDETSRFFSALVYKLTKATAGQVMHQPPSPNGLPTEMFAFGAGVVPGISPILNVAGAWKDYASGQNPMDPFRNRPVISQQNFNAGGTAAARDMIHWTLSQSGLLNLVAWNPKADTTTELAVSATPIINRLLKISDQGKREAQMNSETLDTQAKAKLRVQYNDDTRALLAQHAWLQKLGPEKRTQVQNQRYAELHVWKTRLYDLADEAAWNSRDHRETQRNIIQQVNTAATKELKRLKPTESAMSYLKPAK